MDVLSSRLNSMKPLTAINLPKTLPINYGNDVTEFIILYDDPSIGAFGNNIHGWDRCNDSLRASRLWSTECYPAGLYKRAGDQYILVNTR